MELSDFEDDDLIKLMDDYENRETQTVSSNTTIPEEPKDEHFEVLSRCFGHKSFRPLQWEIISSIIYSKRDVCAIMSTGYGKSLCFQFPSTFLGGITLVISPLIALMEDQVLSLQVSNIPACLLGTAQKNQKQVIDDIFNKKYSFVYLTPEFCTGDFGNDILNRISTELSVVLIAIDEAHCISTWGHDFRHQYRKLIILRNIFKNVPVIAVTATATPKVRQDIIQNLNLQNPLLICTGFNRPNLYFEINLKGSSGVFNDLKKCMNGERGFSGSTIIYCITRKETEDVASTLTDNGIKCRPYHAGLSLNARAEAHELFVKDKIDVVVATIAFGMGIDKPDIRNVIHYGCSKSIENYYQEVGRAGRDGQPAFCVTFYSPSDFQIIRRVISQISNREEQNETKLKQMEEFLTSLKCRRRFILEYFEDKIENLDQTNCCDFCTKKSKDSRSDFQKYEGLNEQGHYDFTDDSKILLNAIKSYNNAKLGLSSFILFLRGSHNTRIPESRKKHPLFGSGYKQPEAWWKALARFLIQENYLTEKTEKANKFLYSAVYLTEKGHAFLANDKKLLAPPNSLILGLLKKKVEPAGKWIDCKKFSHSSSSQSQAKTENETEIAERMALYQKLLKMRGELASKLECMPYMVASNFVLMSMAKSKPQSLTDLRSLKIDGFPEAKIEKFGAKFLEVICEKDNKVETIRDILTQFPLPESGLSATAQVSYNMFQSGLTIKEIAEKRGVTPSTIVSHLIVALKNGLPIKLVEFGVSDESRELIIRVFQQLYGDDFSRIRLANIKEQCPPEITYDEIRAVVAYCQIRCHLTNLNLVYEEFEDFDFSDFKIEKQIECHQTEAPMKKIKLDDEKAITDAILDSPPREEPLKPILDSPPCEEPLKPILDSPPCEEPVKPNSNDVKNKKKELPPWLVKKKLT